MPRSILIETTKDCNLKCPGCRRNYREGSISSEPGPQHLTVAALWRIIATTPCQLIRFEGDGEPLTNPFFGDLVKYLHKVGIKSAMTTNGTLLDEVWVKLLEENGMRRIHVSFDGATKNVYERNKLGGDYEETLRNCKLVGDSKIQLFMNIVLYSDETVEELPKYVELAKKVGATGVHYMKMQLDNLDFGNPPNLSVHLNTIKKFRKKAEEEGLMVVGTCSDTPTFVPCYDPYINPFVLLNNDIYGCTYMASLRRAEVYQDELIPTPYKNYRMGNLEDNWMKDIWKNEAYKELRETLKDTIPNKGYRSIPPERLLELKKARLKSTGRFAFCQGCLCQWGESGL